MKNYRGLLFLVLSAFFADAVFSANGAQFLNEGFGAKAKGLGGAYGVIVNDPSSLFWNPAGLANIDGEIKRYRKINIQDEAEKAFEDGEFEDFINEGAAPPEKKAESAPPVDTERTFEMNVYGSFGELSLDRQIAFVGTGFTFLGGSLGAGALGTLVDGISGYDETGGSTGSKEYSAFAGYLGYAMGKGSGKYGLSLMGFQENLGGNSLYGGGVNAGIQYGILPILAVGMDIQNLVGIMQKNVSQSGEYQRLDSILHFNMALSTPPPNSNIKLLLGFTSNIDEPETEAFMPNIGVAYGISKYAYIMMGLDNGYPSGGLGISMKHFNLAYSINRDKLGEGFQHYAEFNFIF